MLDLSPNVVKNLWKNNLNISQANSIEINNLNYSIASKNISSPKPSSNTLLKTQIAETETKNEDSENEVQRRGIYVERRCVKELIDSYSNRNSINVEPEISKVPLEKNEQRLSTNLNDEERKELEKSRERILNRFKEQQEKEKQVEVAVKPGYDEQYQSRLKNRLTKSKKKRPHKENEDEKISKNRESIPLQDAIKEIDDYTRMLMEKPVNAKRSRKFTRLNFVLDEVKI